MLIKSKVFEIITGVTGLICGLSFVYLGMGELMNPIYKKSILPVGNIEQAYSS